MRTLPKIALFILGLSFIQMTWAENDVTVKRTSVTNLVTDSAVFGASEKTLLPSVFVITSNSTGQEIYWSPEACRLIAVRNGKETSYRELIAEGIHPFARSLGSMGKPKFFGFRMEEGGTPVFLYTYGQLSIEEKFEISTDGKWFKQHYTINSGAISGAYVMPTTWRDISKIDKGRWEQTQLSLTRDEMNAGLAITYFLDPSLQKSVAEN